MADFVDATLAEIRSRKLELQAAFEEYDRLEAAEIALSNLGSAPSRGSRSRPQKARSTAGRKATRRTSTSAGTGQRGRPKGSGKRQAQAVKIIAAAPGISTSEVAKKMGIKPNYLYRVLPDLMGEGKLRKNGRGWYATAAS